MGGLVAYASSDEDDDIQDEVPETAPKHAPSNSSTLVLNQTNLHTEPTQEVAPTEPEEPAIIGPVQQHTVPLGPALPPMEDTFTIEEAEDGQHPASPYSANRALLRELTLPPVPNLDIPPSPPGSPPPAINKKFEQFLELKKKGVHFNAKLAQSAALKNPSLMDKLMDFVELDEKDQYATTLSTDLWNPNGFPDWAFRGPLKKSQERIRKEREAEKASGTRSALDFVPASNPSKGVDDASGVGGLSRGGKRKAGAW